MRKPKVPAEFESELSSEGHDADLAFFGYETTFAIFVSGENSDITRLLEAFIVR